MLKGYVLEVFQQQLAFCAMQFCPFVVRWQGSMNFWYLIPLILRMTIYKVALYYKKPIIRFVYEENNSFSSVIVVILTSFDLLYESTMSNMAAPVVSAESMCILSH